MDNKCAEQKWIDNHVHNIVAASQKITQWHLFVFVWWIVTACLMQLLMSYYYVVLFLIIPHQCFGLL